MRSWLTALFTFVLTTGCTGGTDTPSTEGCEGPLGKPISLSNINAMTACCQAEAGQAHCLDAAKVPGEIQPLVATCDSGGYCIPDEFLKTGASVPPATCTAFGGAGVCLSKCIPQVAENEGLLRQDTCTNPDDLCVPCISPLDMMPTHACDLLELAVCKGDEPPPNPVNGCDDPATCNYEASCPAVIDPAAAGLTACGDDAHCLDAALIADPAQAAQLAKCDDATKLCVPDVFIRSGGKFTPATCTSVNGAEGRCLSTVLPQVKDQAALLPQDTCATTERCTPCFNPIDGTSTGACNVSCDIGAQQPAKPFAQCCDARARCVPKVNIPDDQEAQLSEQECADTQAGSLCVPVELLENGPFPTCNANSFILGNYTGVCLSDCLDFGIQGIALARGSCSNNFTCAPCTQNGQPTGAPGCPP
jgi:hypothetical protein